MIHETSDSKTQEALSILSNLDKDIDKPGAGARYLQLLKRARRAKRIIKTIIMINVSSSSNN
jgi:hypothetical protein